MKRNFSTGLLWMVFVNIDLLMAIDVRHSPSIIGQRSVDDIFSQAKENSGGNNKDPAGRTPNTTLGPRPQPRINDGISRRATSDDRRQPINSAPGSYITTENSDPMMFPGMFWHPFASWGMRYANPMQRSMPPWWSTWYQMNPMLSFWNRFARYNEPAPARYGQYYGDDSRYQPGKFDGNFASYPGDSRGRYSGYNQQPSTSLYYSNQLTGSNMQQPSQQYYDEHRITPSVQQYQTTNPAQPSYGTQRIESKAQLPPPPKDYSQQSRTEPNIQIIPSSQNNIDRTRLELQDRPQVPESQNNREGSIKAAEPLARRVSSFQAPIYRNQPVKSNVQEKTNTPVTLIPYFDDSLENQNGQSQDTTVSPTPENRAQRISSNVKSQGV